jgi:glycine/sarcosine N-methyltransferase
MKNIQFYDSLSVDYDSMLDFSKLTDTRTEALKKFIKNGYRNAIDIGCGTGADSIALARNGLNVTGYDTSEKMLQKAKLNSKQRNLRIRFSSTPVQSAGTGNHSKFDIVVSLGNAIANISPAVLSKIIRKVYKLLKPGGSFIFQILNYNSVRKADKRIVNITSGKGNMFIRFYDFEKHKLIFNVLRVNESNVKEYDLITTELFEYKRADLKALLNKSGFNKIEYYSDLNKSKFEQKTSKDLLVIAVK